MISVGNLARKAMGLGTLGMVAYDAHVCGKIKAADTQRECNAASASDAYFNTIGLDKPSVVQDKVKKGFMNLVLEENITDFFEGIGGYIKGASSMLVSDVVPTILAFGALAPKKIISKISAAGLLAYAGVFFIQDVLGLGKDNPLSSRH